MTDLKKLASKYVDEKSDTDGFYDAFIAGYEAALRIHNVRQCVLCKSTTSSYNNHYCDGCLQEECYR